MFQYIIKRLLLLMVTFFGITVITFILTRLTPGDPATLRVQGATGGAQAVGGYEDLVELNRRNLGLDKPMVLNLRFEDREVMANRALDDYLRATPFWQRMGERHLGRVTTIALKPAIDRLAALEMGDESTDTHAERGRFLPPGEQRQRLLRIIPRLAAQSGLDREAAAADDPLVFWQNWYAEHKGRYEESNVRDLVARYLAADSTEAEEALSREVLRAGGFAVPHLMRGVNAGDLDVRLRANRALQSQIGFTFASDETEFARIADEVSYRWRSWWRRERISFSSYTPFRHAVHIISNTQFGLWFGQALTFDFGDSYDKRKPVLSLMAQALPISLLLSGLSIIISYLIAIPIGILSAIRRHTVSDSFITLILFILYSLPSFWVAGILILTTTGPPFLDWFPPRGLSSPGIVLGAEDVGFLQWLGDRAWHLVLPVTCLTYGSLAFISRQMRSAMLETINQDYIRTAQAKGLPWRKVVFKHALRNSLIPILTISAGILPELIAGAIIIESIFTIPGMGVLTFEAIVKRDYPVINAVLYFSAFLTLLGILLVDLSYALVDPRIKYS